MQSLGLDVGGANTKAVLLKDGEVQKHWFKYLPLWKDKKALDYFLNVLAKSARPNVVGATLTGELCDVFSSRREGVVEIVEAVCNAFGDEICLFMSLDGTLLARDQSLTSLQKLAAANWVASTLVVGKKYPNCLFIDVGSTTTDIIPVRRGKPVSIGHTDLQRLRTGELVYMGVLRTPLPCICSEVSLGKEKIGVAAENFAIAADIYRVLGIIKEGDYTCETPDGGKKDRKGCMKRVARIFCSDVEEIGEKQILEAAKIFHDEQTDHVARALKKVMRLHRFPRGTKIVMAGLGRRILAEKAARAAGFNEIIDLAAIYGEEAALMTPAFSAGLLATGAFEHGRRD